MKSSEAGNNKTAVILAGGRSSRFGGDKLMSRINSTTLLEILIATLESAGFNIVIAGHRNYRRFGHPVLEDLSFFEGPLSALAGVFERLSAPKILLVAGDMPLITSPLIDLLWNRSADTLLTLPEGPCGIVPLPGVYSRSLMPVIRRALQNGRRDLLFLKGESPSLAIVGKETIATVDPGERSFRNINTRDDLSQVQQTWGLPSPRAGSCPKISTRLI